MVAIRIIFEITGILPLLILVKRQLSLLFVKGKSVLFIRAVERNIFCYNACPVYNVTVGGNLGLVLLIFKIWMVVCWRRHNFCISRQSFVL
jgi:hypothetical protein